MGQVGANYPHRRRRVHQARPHRSALRSRTAGSAEPRSPASTTVAKFETQDFSVGPTRATEVCSADVTATNAAVAAERRTPVPHFLQNLGLASSSVILCRRCVAVGRPTVVAGTGSMLLAGYELAQGRLRAAQRWREALRPYCQAATEDTD